MSESDPFGADTQFTSAPAYEGHDLTPPESLRNPLDLSQFTQNDNQMPAELTMNQTYSTQLQPDDPFSAAPATADDQFTAPPSDAIDLAFVQMTPAESQAAFIGGYVPQVIEAPAAIVPTVVDPMASWLATNAAALKPSKRKDVEEVAAKKAAAEKAKAFLTKTDADRKKAMDARKANNRAAQKASPDAGVPEGKTWEKVFKLTDFSHDKARTKDLGRFKTVLTHCKELDVKVAIKA